MRHAKPVRLETAPTGPDKSGSKPRGESVYLFLEFTIVFNSAILKNRDGKFQTEISMKRETYCEI